MQPLRFSVGDEFQAAYATAAQALRATILLRLRFKAEELDGTPVRDQDVRIGLSYGEIEVFDAESAPFGQSGPAWWQARLAIEEAERRERGYGLPYSSRSSFVGEDPQLSAITNALLLALDQVVFRMDRKDVLVALGSLEGKTQTAIGQELGIRQSTVSKRFKNNGPATLVTIFEALADPRT